MATSIDRVRRAVAQTPWAILPEKLEQICEFLALRTEGHLSAEEIRAAAGSKREARYAGSGGVAVLPVFGTISQRMDMLSEMSGGTSTESIGKAFDQFVNDSDIGTIVLHVDSPGGTVSGVPELAEKIHRARGQGTRIVAVADSMAASAAYWIASAADEVVVTPSGVVGSIGVYTLHQDASRMFENAGIKNTIIRAGKHKAEGSPYEPMSADALAYAQGQIDEIYDEFVQAVAKHRGVTATKVESGFGQGRVVRAKTAVAQGMADRIATMEEVLADLGVGRMQRRDGARAEMGGQHLAATALARMIADRYAEEGDEITITLGDVSATVVADNGPSRTIAATVYTAAEQNEHTTGVAGAAPEEAHDAPDTKPAPEAREQAMSEKDTAVAGNGAAPEEPRIAVGVNLTEERQRARAITELCEMHGIKGEAGDFIASGASVHDVIAQVRSRAQANLDSMKASHVELNEKEQRQYSLSRAIMGAAARLAGERVQVDDGFEREISEQIARNMPKDYKSRGGFFYPIRAAGLEAATNSAGGYTVFTQEGQFIDLLRARMKVAELGATILTGLEGGTIAFPKQSGSSTWTWVEENPGSDVSDSDATFTQVLLAPKAGQSSTAYSRQLLQQSSIDAEMFVRNDLTTVAALGIDSAAIEGTGSNNQPTGILNTAGIGSVPGGTNGAVPTYDHMVDLETAIAVDNADIGSMAYLTTPGIRGKLKKTQQFASTNGVPVWVGGREGEVNGYPAHVSTQVPSDLTKGTASGICHAVLFGVWSQLLIGYWGALELVVDPYRLKKQAMIEVTSYQSIGLAVRHAEAFAAMTDALTSAS